MTSVGCGSPQNLIGIELGCCCRPRPCRNRSIADDDPVGLDLLELGLLVVRFTTARSRIAAAS
eukprot:9484016-Pyramimonas_sp.AAC.1